MPINSIRKGKRIERAYAAHLRELGFADAARGQQHKGGPDSPDVRGIEGVHIEVKGGYKGVDLGSKVLIAWRRQAMDEAGPNECPCLAWKPDRKPWRLDWPLGSFDDPHLWVTVCGVESERAAYEYMRRGGPRHDL